MWAIPNSMDTEKYDSLRWFRTDLMVFIDSQNRFCSSRLNMDPERNSFDQVIDVHLPPRLAVCISTPMSAEENSSQP